MKFPKRTAAIAATLALASGCAEAKSEEVMPFRMPTEDAFVEAATGEESDEFPLVFSAGIFACNDAVVRLDVLDTQSVLVSVADWGNIQTPREQDLSALFLEDAIRVQYETLELQPGDDLQATFDSYRSRFEQDLETNCEVYRDPNQLTA